MIRKHIHEITEMVYYLDQYEECYRYGLPKIIRHSHKIEKMSNHTHDWTQLANELYEREGI